MDKYARNNFVERMKTKPVMDAKEGESVEEVT